MPIMTGGLRSVLSASPPLRRRPAPIAAAAVAAAALQAGCTPPAFVQCALVELFRGDPAPQPPGTRTVTAAVETAPVDDPCDAADDPAIWVNAASPADSLIVAANKARGLVVYGLDGGVVSQLDAGRVNNVDLRAGVTVSSEETIVVAGTNRTTNTIDLFALDPEAGTLAPLHAEPIATDLDEPYGICLYRSAASGGLYVFANDHGGVVEQWRLDDAGRGGLTGTLVRSWAVGGQTEGCVADDANGWVFIGEEAAGVWRYAAEPSAPTDRRTAVDATGQGAGGGGRLAADVEGLALWVPPGGGPRDGFLVASSQGNHTYVVYDRAPPHAWRGTFRIAAGAGGIDGAEDTDGVDVVAAPLGPRYPMGLLVVQDGINTEPDGSGAHQNFKLVSWADVAGALDLRPSASSLP